MGVAGGEGIGDSETSGAGSGCCEYASGGYDGGSISPRGSIIVEDPSCKLIKGSPDCGGCALLSKPSVASLVVGAVC